MKFCVRFDLFGHRTESFLFTWGCPIAVEVSRRPGPRPFPLFGLEIFGEGPLNHVQRRRLLSFNSINPIPRVRMRMKGIQPMASSRRVQLRESAEYFRPHGSGHQTNAEKRSATSPGTYVAFRFGEQTALASITSVS